MYTFGVFTCQPVEASLKQKHPARDYFDALKSLEAEITKVSFITEDTNIQLILNQEKFS